MNMEEKDNNSIQTQTQLLSTTSENTDICKKYNLIKYPDPCSQKNTFTLKSRDLIELNSLNEIKPEILQLFETFKINTFDKILVCNPSQLIKSLKKINNFSHKISELELSQCILNISKLFPNSFKFTQLCYDINSGCRIYFETGIKSSHFPKIKVICM